MQKRRIGSLETSVVGLGTNNFGTQYFGRRCDRDDAIRVVHTALDVGVTFIDTAESYSITTAAGGGRSEEFIGEALGSRRDEVVIASKFSSRVDSDPEERGADRVVAAVEGSLRRLGTDRIDLYQYHHPDPDVPVGEILEALDRLVEAGKVVEIGCCNHSGAMIDEARAVSATHGWAPFVTAQNVYNVLDPPTEAGVLAACARHGMGLLPAYPLASGLLTGKYRKGHPPPPGTRLAAETPIAERERQAHLSDERLDTVALLQAFAEERGHTLLELAFSWLASQPLVASVIAGATRPEQVIANAAAAQWPLTPDDLDDVRAIVG